MSINTSSTSLDHNRTEPSPITTAAETHNRPTRLLHAALAVSIVTQLGSSLLMVAPLRNNTPNVLFEIHEYSGLAAVILSAAFWITIFTRRSGTPVARLLPWFSSANRRLLWQDAKQHWSTLRGKHLPAYESGAPLATAVHGLGLLLILAMAMTGAVFYLSLVLGTPEAAWASVDLEVHKLLATLTWAYLVGHAGVALLYRHVGQLALDRMWSFKPDSESEQAG